jgi:hypothetical protein
MKISFKLALVVALIPFAQMYARIVSLKGSLDKMWLMIPIFMIPPISFVPAGMMYFGKVKPGEGGKPYDNFVWIAILGSLILRLVNNFEILPDNKIIEYVVTIIVPIIISTIMFYIRDMKSCKTLTDKNGSFLRALQSAVIQGGTAKIMNVLIGFIPVLGTIIGVLSGIGPLGLIIETIVESVCIFVSHIILNMYNGQDMEYYCRGRSNKAFTSTSIIFFILMTAHFFLSGILADVPLIGMLFSKNKLKGLKSQIKNPKMFAKSFGRQARGYVQNQARGYVQNQAQGYVQNQAQGYVQNQAQGYAQDQYYDQ